MNKPALGLLAETRVGSALAPVQDYLVELHERVSGLTGGKPADYIPELGKANPAAFGIALATVDGEVYSVGNSNQAFTIQSVSKPFMYGYALQRYGREAVLTHVGVEPTGEAFNSIVLDEVANRPFNPMVNAGAIAVAELMGGQTQEQRTANMLALFGGLAGRELSIDEQVFRSEEATGHRNRAIAYMMLNTGMIRRDPNEVLDLYFRQCSVNVIRRDYRGDVVSSNRLRTPEERKVLAKDGHQVVVIEVQGALFFGSTEQLLRRLTQLAVGASFVVVDFKRVHFADTSARQLIYRAARAMAGGEAELGVSTIADDGPLGPLARDLIDHGEAGRVVRRVRGHRRGARMVRGPVARPLAPGELGAEIRACRARSVQGTEARGVAPDRGDRPSAYLRQGRGHHPRRRRGETVLRTWRAARSACRSRPWQRAKKRVASIGPGLSFGEMALLDGGKRSADIVADERVVCYGLAVEQLHELGAQHPSIMVTILGNLTREFSERLRHANEEIRALE